MKRVAAYFLLVIFLYNSLGNYLVYELNKLWLQEEMQALIKSQKGSDRFLVIRVYRAEAHPDLQRIDRKEFIYKGHLYDIVRETRSGDITSFLCIPDHKEELLASGFKRVQNGKSSMALRYHLITQALPILHTSLLAGPTASEVLFLEAEYPLNATQLDLPGHPPELS